MKNNVSVDKAIRIGHIMVNIPVFFLLLGLPALLSYFDILKLLYGMLVGFILAWLIWSVLIPKWKVWAFNKIENIKELEKRAVEEKLIWEDGNIFEKTEIWSKLDRLKWKEIQNKINK